MKKCIIEHFNSFSFRFIKQISYISCSFFWLLNHEILKNRQGKIIIEVIEATVLDDDGNACDDFGFYVKYDSGKYEKGDRVQTAFVYNPENNYLDDILYEVDTLI